MRYELYGHADDGEAIETAIEAANDAAAMAAAKLADDPKATWGATLWQADRKICRIR